jgi:hypothetical protein
LSDPVKSSRYFSFGDNQIVLLVQLVALGEFFNQLTSQTNRTNKTNKTTFTFLLLLYEACCRHSLL